FEFGRDTRNGHRVEAYVTAGELIPYDVRSVVRYVDVSEIECICLEGAPLRSWGFGATYAGCAPSGAGDEPDDRKRFVVTTHPADGKSEYEIAVSAGVPSPRLSFLGFPSKIDRINGAAIRSASQIDAMIVDLLTARIRTTRSWQSGSTEFHYISRDTLDHL